jgi:hypothetical protein
MKKNQQALFHRTKTEQQFLFYKTDEKSFDENPESPRLDSPANLSTVFPGIKIGTSFLEHARTYVEPLSRFGALVIKMDMDKEKDTPHDPSSTESINVVNTIDRLCEKDAAFWGGLDNGLFACLVPDKDSDACLNMATRLQTSLSKTGNNTVSIGIAAYPTLSFEKDRIIDNARKAIDHAAFFGPNSTVVFVSGSGKISGDHLYKKGYITKSK